MSAGFAVSEARITELEELNNALQDQVYVLQRDLRHAKERVHELERERDHLRQRVSQMSEAVLARDD
jgi:chromosome segregation ATPase